MTLQFLAFHVGLASILVMALLLPAGPQAMRYVILSVSAVLMLAVPTIGAVMMFGQPVPPDYWRWLWFLSILGMPAGYAMALTVVPSCLLRPTSGNYSAEALVALALMAVGLLLTNAML